MDAGRRLRRRYHQRPLYGRRHGHHRPPCHEFQPRQQQIGDRSGGKLTEIAPDVPAVTDLGLLLEPARTPGTLALTDLILPGASNSADGTQTSFGGTSGMAATTGQMLVQDRRRRRLACRRVQAPGQVTSPGRYGQRHSCRRPARSSILLQGPRRSFRLQLVHSAVTWRHSLTAFRRRSMPATIDATRCSGTSVGRAFLTEAMRSAAVS
jgi:hypothetical protein